MLATHMIQIIYDDLKLKIKKTLINKSQIKI